HARALEKMLKDDDTDNKKLGTLNLLHEALEKRGKDDEAKKVFDRIEVIETALDKKFAKENLEGIDIEKFGKRKGKSSRVVLCELFTGAQCPPCVAADVAFDAALETYKPSEVVFLQYHLHIPGPDSLTNADSEARQNFYGSDEIEGTPTMFVDGKATTPMGGR